MSIDDPFNGTWRFSPALSTLTTPAPEAWLMQVRTEGERIQLRETITRSGAQIISEIDACFDGAEYPVHNSAAADRIAYTRSTAFLISGTGKKNGVPLLTENIAVDAAARQLTRNYRIATVTRELAAGR